MDVKYLTYLAGGACDGKDAALDDSEFGKFDFYGPGCLAQAVAEIDGKKHLVAHLFIQYESSCWGEDGGDYPPESEAWAYAQEAAQFIQVNLPEGAICLPVSGEDPGLLVVRAAIPLAGLKDASETAEVLEMAFGDFCLPAIH